jgi:hypothetical protein
VRSSLPPPAPVFYYESLLPTILPNVAYSEESNSEYIGATLPVLQFRLSNDFNIATLESVRAVVTMEVSNASDYSWTSGPAPSIAGNQAVWSINSPALTESVASGVSLPVQDEDTKLIFVAGALLGIAGGALVGAIQEALPSSEVPRLRGGPDRPDRDSNEEEDEDLA